VLCEIIENCFLFKISPAFFRSPNQAERALRRAVLWRRKSFGTQSETGSRFVERILTVVTTLRQQRRSVLDYLKRACSVKATGENLSELNLQAV